MSFFRLLIILLLLSTPTAVAAAVTRDATAVGGKRRGMVGGRGVVRSSTACVVLEWC